VIGGILLAAKLGRGDVSAGNGLMLDAVAAALIGYAVLGANRPNVFGTIVGAIFVGVLLNGLTMLERPLLLPGFRQGRGSHRRADGHFRACPSKRRLKRAFSKKGCAVMIFKSLVLGLIAGESMRYDGHGAR
jgi:hypothetical protein